MAMATLFSYVYMVVAVTTMMMVVSGDIWIQSSMSSPAELSPLHPPDCSGSIVSFIGSCAGYLDLLRVADPLMPRQQPRNDQNMPPPRGSNRHGNSTVSHTDAHTDEIKMDKKKSKGDGDNLKEMQSMCCASISDQLMVHPVSIIHGTAAAAADGKRAGADADNQNLTCTCAAMDVVAVHYPGLKALLPSVCGLTADFIHARCHNASSPLPGQPATGGPPMVLSPPPPQAPALSPESMPPTAQAAGPQAASPSYGSNGGSSSSPVNESGMLQANGSLYVDAPMPSPSPYLGPQPAAVPSPASTTGISDSLPPSMTSSSPSPFCNCAYSPTVSFILAIIIVAFNHY